MCDIDRNHTTENRNQTSFNIDEFDDTNLYDVGGRNLHNLDHSYSQNTSLDLSRFPKDLTIITDGSKKELKPHHSHSKMTMNFLAVSREKNKKRAYLDWNDKPMLLINQNEIQPMKDTISHGQLPTQPLFEQEIQ